VLRVNSSDKLLLMEWEIGKNASRQINNLEKIRFFSISTTLQYLLAKLRVENFYDQDFSLVIYCFLTI